MNATRHDFTGRLLVGLQHGPFADDPDELAEFIQAVLEELQPGSAQERAEALNIAGLYVRRARLVELEALALQHATRTAPAGLPALLGEPTARERAGARALALRPPQGSFAREGTSRATPVPVAPVNRPVSAYCSVGLSRWTRPSSWTRIASPSPSPEVHRR